MMRVLMLVVLMVVAGEVQAWPWTTPEDCQKEHATKALGKWSLGVIYASCRWKYGENQAEHDAYKGACILDRLDEPRSEAAFKALVGQCFQEAPAKPPNPFLKSSEPPQLPTGCRWFAGREPGMFDHIRHEDGSDPFMKTVILQAHDCANNEFARLEGRPPLPVGFTWVDDDTTFEPCIETYWGEVANIPTDLSRASYSPLVARLYADQQACIARAAQ